MTLDSPSSDISNTRDDTVLHNHLYPDDIYTPEGTYWADLPISQRISFINRVNNDVAKSELMAIRRMAKIDPRKPVMWYLKNTLVPGIGLGLEGYVLFSIGNLKLLFETVWPQCWKTFEVCKVDTIRAVTYLEVTGIMFGQITVGIIGDTLGHRVGLIQDVIIMCIGLIMLMASWGASLQGWVIFYSISIFVYGFGLGGEFPMTATVVMDGGVNAAQISTREDRLHRGRKVVMAFLMQGWGELTNVTSLIVFLLILNGGEKLPYSVKAAQGSFRISFAIPALGTLWLIYYRWFKMPLASKKRAAEHKASSVTGYNKQSLMLSFTHFGSRILGTGGTWFCNDVLFYGNKLFQSAFIKVIDPASAKSGDIIVGWKWSLINICVSIFGYYLAAVLIDNKLYGRKLMQQVGFFMVFVLFVIPSFHYEHYRSPEHVKEFQTMYFLSSFFTQFGPNCVTFLIAAEVYPNSVRATAHGISAAMGKSGALLASILYNYIDDQTKFIVVPWFGFLGMILTTIFVPDTTGLDLNEQDRRWKYLRSGRGAEYHGIAVHPQHLSMWERFRGIGKSYNPELDRISRIKELQVEWEERRVQRAKNDEAGIDDDEYPAEVNAWFSQLALRTSADETKEKA